MPKILTLAVKKQYFNEIKSGIKKEEFRAIKDYWTKRLKKNYNEVHITLGYPKKDEINKILKFKFIGYERKLIKHKEFGEKTIEVYAIQLKEKIK